MSDIDPYQGWQPLEPAKSNLQEFSLVHKDLHLVSPINLTKRFVSPDAPNGLHVEVETYRHIEITVRTNGYRIRLNSKPGDDFVQLLDLNENVLGHIRATKFEWQAGLLHLDGIGDFRFQRKRPHGYDILSDQSESLLSVYSAWQDSKQEAGIAFYAQWPAEKNLPDYYPAWVAAGLQCYTWMLYVEDHPAM